MSRDHKLINGRPQKITSIPLDHGGVICNPREADLIDYGCKELVRPEPPTYTYTEEYDENETQIIVKYIEIQQVIEPWHEQTNFQIKFRPMDLLDLLKAHKAMIEYTDSLTQYTDIMENVYFYVNYFNDMERELIEHYGGIVNERVNI